MTAVQQSEAQAEAEAHPEEYAANRAKYGRKP
ncbi:MAG: hypothetical protein QOI01_1639 [Mycobacterium sp.]|jgi:hypothetical protein|nr:hypothetical protein [Mycobacterium sp.]